MKVPGCESGPALDGLLMKSSGMRRMGLRSTWRSRRALRYAQILDDIVDSQVTVLPYLPEAQRQRSADYLAELVSLAQAYRHFAAGWISRGELQRRARESLGHLEAIRRSRTEQLTEHE